MKLAASYAKREKHILVGGGTVRHNPKGLSPPEMSAAGGNLPQQIRTPSSEKWRDTRIASPSTLRHEFHDFQ